MSTAVRKRLIARRGDDSDDLENEIIIELSDEDTISISDTSSEDEILQVPATLVCDWSEKSTRSNRRAALENPISWADEVVEESQVYTKRESPSRKESSSQRDTSSKKEKKKSSSSAKKVVEDPATARWAHDMYEEEPTIPPKPRSQRQRGLKNSPSLNKTKELKIRKHKSLGDFVKLERVSSVAPIPNDDTTLPIDLINQLSISGSVNVITDEDVTTESVLDSPRVRRGISQAAKNQLIASINKNALVKPLSERNSHSPVAKRESKNEPRVHGIDSNNRIGTSSSRNSSKRSYSSDRKIDRQSNRSKGLTEAHKPSNEHNQISKQKGSQSKIKTLSSSKSQSNFKTVYPDKLPDQLITTVNGGWALVNPSNKSYADTRNNSMDRSDGKIDDRNVRNHSEKHSGSDRNGKAESTEHDYRNRARNSKNGYDQNSDRLDSRESRPLKSKKPIDSQSATNSISQPLSATLHSSATYGKEPFQPMINVQPMMTQSGHMVLLTENGLCVPATPGMFEYEQWYQSQSNHIAAAPYYYSPYYAEEPDTNT